MLSAPFERILEYTEPLGQLSEEFNTTYNIEMRNYPQVLTTVLCIWNRPSRGLSTVNVVLCSRRLQGGETGRPNQLIRRRK